MQPKKTIFILKSCAIINVMKKLFLYVHGKGGSYKEEEIFQNYILNADVVGIDYDDYRPWITRDVILKSYLKLAPQYDEVNIIANSIGAYFSMLALNGQDIKSAYFISPVLDMERLILDMMSWANVTESELEKRKEIPTDFGETLSFEYLTYVRNNPLKWDIKTYILYGERDSLIPFETVRNYIKNHDANLTIMKGGEHYFHTQKQLDCLKNWLKANV